MKAEKISQDFDAPQSPSPCKQEVYGKPEDSLINYLSIFEKQFRVPEVDDKCIRLYYLPSSEKEMVVDLCPSKSFVRVPDTGTVQNSIQIVQTDEKGNVLGGRIAKSSDSIPRLDIKTELVEEAFSKEAYHKLDSIDIWSMQSIDYADCIMFDGTGIDVQTRKNSSRNHFRFSKTTYKDKRYNLISGLLDSLYSGQ